MAPIGQYDGLMPELPYGHNDVIQPVEIDPDSSKERIRTALKTLNKLPKEYGLRCSVTHDLEKHPGAFIVRLIGPEKKIDEFREALALVKF